AYVPEAVFSYRGEPVSVSVAQLLSNSSGLPEDNAWADRNLYLTREDIAALVRAGLPLTRPPGTAYQYSNIGQSLVARAVEAATGRDAEDVVRTRLLEPLGLVHTRFRAGDYPPGTDLALGFRTFDSGSTFVHEPYVASGAMACTGGLFSTAADVAAWMWFLGSAFLDDPVRPDLLAPASRRELQLGRTPMTIGGDDADARLDARGYGYGLKVELDSRFGRIVSHSGGLPGFNSDMRWHVASGCGVVVLANVDAFNKTTRVSEKTLLGVLERLDAPSEIVRPWGGTLRTAEAVDRALRQGGSLADLGDLLSSNVLADVPDDVRRRRLDALLEVAGPIRADQAPFAARILTAPDPAALRWRIDCDHGALVAGVRLMALADPLVQTVEVALADPSGRKPAGEPPGVTDHVRVV
ncbi:MAG: beta-lactamase family protein, partial [Actinomycetia bacterium]|nr:beta-lactamase family protein [Actinomycetes bacterium]